MHQERQIKDDIYYVGYSDRRLSLFENVYPLPDGISYNSYLILDEKTILLDTVDKSIGKVFFENIEYLLGDRKLDYVVINHMEPDHAATLEELVERFPEVTIVGNAKTFGLIKQFFNFSLQGRMLEVKEKSTLSTGRHEFTFFTASMVHWPEVMVTYDTSYRMLYTADAFGTFGALSGNLFADEMNFERDWLNEARRYYTNIVGKYGVQVQALLNKVSGLEIEYLCPLHGPVWRKQEGILWMVNKYALWSTYTPEDREIVIYSGSVYGGTDEAAYLLAGEIAKRGVSNIRMYDVSLTDTSFLVAEAFRAKVLIFASASYNGGLFPNMDFLLEELKVHNFQNRKVLLLENGSWAMSATKRMKEHLSAMKNIEILPETLNIKSSLKQEQLEDLLKMADAAVAALE